jgi:hypothetical protein
VNFDQSIKIATGIKEKAGAVDVTIPKDLPQVKDGSVWYLRLGTGLSTAPQVSFLCFSAWFPLLWLYRIIWGWICFSFGRLMLITYCRCPLCSTLLDRLLLPRLRCFRYLRLEFDLK